MQQRMQQGQSIVEYAVLFVLVITAFAAMQVYAKRSLQARVKSGSDAVTRLSATIASKNDSTLTSQFERLDQYEPYYAESSYQTYSENVAQEHMGAGQIKKEMVSNVTARAAGGYQRQKGAVGRGDADALWDQPAPPKVP